MKLNTIAFLSFFYLAFLPGANAQVEFIAHRGASYLAPENTLASAKLGWELGADAVEIDVNLSKDHRIMVIHDSNTKRTTGQDYQISETHSGILRQLDAGSFKGEKFKGEKIPFLEEVIELLPPGKKLVIELKSRKETIPWLKKTVKRCGKKEQLLFICFDWETIVKTKKAFPDNVCYWLCGKKDELMERMSDVKRYRLNGLDLKYSVIDREVMDRADKLGLDVVAYTVNKPEEAKRLVGLGVKAITTDRPAWLKSQIE
ncbi:MAG: glycerophosphodiester phosphodiesterase family protein [Prolixibacteraceae bacterium]|nr:glycerophosphodiester phosphodiesterase family protein [Prolixibacteraceae bacterium]